MSKETVSGGMGIPDEFFEKALEIVKESISSSSKVSDLLLSVAKEVREEHLGEIKEELSMYEKKLILSGFISGTVIQQNNSSNPGLQVLSGILAILNKKDQ